MGFYGSNDPTNSVKALKEVVVLRIGFNPTRSTSPCYNTTHACNIQSYRKYIHLHTYTKMNLSTVKWAQWDKNQSLLAPAHPGGPGKGAVKRVCVVWWFQVLFSTFLHEKGEYEFLWHICWPQMSSNFIISNTLASYTDALQSSKM